MDCGSRSLSDRDLDDQSSDDSDIQEVMVIPAPADRSGSPDGFAPAPAMKRRKSSPQMDPIPIYTPTPIHILEQRARGSRASSPHDDQSFADYLGYSPASLPRSPNYNPHPSDTSPSPMRSEHASARPNRPSLIEYEPLLEPNPQVVGHTKIVSPHPKKPQQPTAPAPPTPRRASNAPRPSASALRPVSSALAQAVARRRNSHPDKERPTPARLAMASGLTPKPTSSSATIAKAAHAEEPVLWSPQLPSEIEAVKVEDTTKPTSIDETANYKSPKIVKTRVAHRPTVPTSKSGRPKMPLGNSKKIPLPLRVKYLDVIITEYLNTGHSEQESYSEGQKEEQSLANRANTKSIYINLVAGLKKKLREKAGVSTLPLDDDPKYINGNKVVSHSEIITGKVIGTFSIQKKRKNCDPSELEESELYDRLLRYVVPVDQLEAYGYPERDPERPNLRKPPVGKDGQRLHLREELASSYTCDRCTKIYRVDDKGVQLPTVGKCIYHPGHLWNVRISRALEKRYSCCKGDPSAGGCSSNPYHVHTGEFEIANYRDYAETKPKPEKDPNKHGIYALDCEMCYTTYGLELTRVTVIDHKSEVIYENLVKPTNRILDYNTKYSGIKDGDLDRVTTTLKDVQADLLEMFSSRSILIGHSLDSDMRALKMFHKHFIDTAQLFPHKRGLPFKRALRTLMVENLQVIIQEDAGHDSKEDASAALRLVLWKAKTDVPEKK